MLQCGRIYKDAEIRWPYLRGQDNAGLQCGRIYKDAEIRKAAGSMVLSAGFNVAASIKMRKLWAARRVGR